MRDVVACLLFDSSQRVMVAQKPSPTTRASWEFPGGKVEPGEQAPQALFREMREEFQVQIEAPVLCGIQQSHDGRWRVQYFLSKTTDPLLPTEHRAITWLSVTDFGAFPLCSTDAAFARSNSHKVSKILKTQVFLTSR